MHKALKKETKTVLTIEYIELPKEIKSIIHDTHYDFRNDCILHFNTEFNPPNSITMEGIIEYYEDQKADNDYEGTLEQFIDDYNLGVEKWLIDEKVDLSGVDEIQIEVSW